jgi:hypothetical protein
MNDCLGLHKERLPELTVRREPLAASDPPLAAGDVSPAKGMNVSSTFARACYERVPVFIGNDCHLLCAFLAQPKVFAIEKFTPLKS